ncbi:MAG: hypothetical protein E7459_11075, partial [Ruminococcaceae bacterium]|nr:hypothetical protein [Oscillospiraceae bacterium]
MKRKVLSMLMAAVMVITCLVPSAMATRQGNQTISPTYAGQVTANGEIVAPDAALPESGEMVTIMVQVEGELPFLNTSDIQIAAEANDRQMAVLAQAENRIEAQLHEDIQVEEHFTLLFNGFSFTGESWMIDAINELDGVTAFEAPVFMLEETHDDGEDINLTPNMGTATEMTTATTAWELGYTGKGTVVAIVDTGIRQTHEAFSVAPEQIKMDKAYLQNVYATHGEKMHGGSAENLDTIYYSDKLPFNWDYFDGDAVPNHTASDHGSHVAGIAAGNNGTTFKGVAPDAQIVAMQVFNANGGASFSDILCALEDCVYLGVDTINMSIGAAAYFPRYELVVSGLKEAYDALEAAGISVVGTSGNTGHSAMWTNQGGYTSTTRFWLSGNPDTGVLSVPGSLPGTLCVAGTANKAMTKTTAYLISGSKECIPYQGSSYASLSALAGKTYELVRVDLSDPAKIEEVGGLEGKIALDLKGGLLAVRTAIANAEAAGAVGIVFYQDTVSSISSSTLPCGMITTADAEAMIASFSDGIHGQVAVRLGYDYATAGMYTATSWGPTSELSLKPEIAAPGQSINSVKGASSDTAYTKYSGTSMAAPHVAGGLLLIKQYLRENFPEDTPAQINEKAFAVAMSTSKQINTFVRQQGAGMIHLESALSTKAFATVNGSRPKLELGEKEDGKFTFTVEVTNFADKEKTFGVDFKAITEEIKTQEYSGFAADLPWAQQTGLQLVNPEPVMVKVGNNTVKDVTSLCKLDAPKTVTVPAGETVSITVTLSCTEELMAYFAEYCPNGMYLEGWIKLNDTDADGVSLNVPFLGYVGDWDKPAVIDDGFWWQIPYGQNNPAQNANTWGTYIGFGAFQPGGKMEQGLGLNPYWDATGKTYVADRNAISPNGDNYLDAVDYLEFSLLRNPKSLKLYVQDEAGNVLETIYDLNYNFRKEYCASANGTYHSYSHLAFDYVGAQLQENEKVYIVLEAHLDHEGFELEKNANARLVFPVTKDLTAPVVTAVEGGIEILDANYIAYYAIYADEARTELVYENGVFAEERGVKESYATDLTTCYVAVADYARNEAVYKVENGVVTNLNDTITKPGKTIIAQQQIDHNTDYTHDLAWVRLDTNNTTVPAYLTEVSHDAPVAVTGNFLLFDILSTMVTIDGTLYGNDLLSLYKLNPETLERERVLDFFVADSRFKPEVWNIMVDPVTYETYAFFLFRGDRFLGKLDMTTGEVVRDHKLSSRTAWAATMVGENTAAYVESGNQQSVITFIDVTTGEIQETVTVTSLERAKRCGGALNIYGYCGNLLYDKDSNAMYLGCKFDVFGSRRENATGIVKYNLNDFTAELLHTGKGLGVSVMGMFFPDDVKAVDWYAVIQLIDSIGEVDTEDGETIKAAREAYDALSDEDKAKVTNYETLVQAEHRYCIVMGEKYANDAKKSAEDAQKAYEDAKKEA